VAIPNRIARKNTALTINESQIVYLILFKESSIEFLEKKAENPKIMR